MLTFAEEILLLNLDDKKGTFRHLPEEALRTALAGALLLELALANRIDTDQHALVLVDSRPMHDSLLDDILRRIKAEKAAPRPVGHWLQEVASEAGNPQDRVLQGLVDKGVLKVEDRKVLWVFAQRRYPLVDGQEVVEVRTRLRALIFSDDIPGPREAVLVGLINACGMVDTLFEEKELARIIPRLTTLSKLELIGREVDQAIGEIFMAMTSYRGRRATA